MPVDFGTQPCVCFAYFQKKKGRATIYIIPAVNNWFLDFNKLNKNPFVGQDCHCCLVCHAEV